MSKTTPAPTQQLIGVQYLRAIAALMVAYYHSLEQIPQYAPLLNRYFLGEAQLANGVDLFFVISGFIMVLTSSRAAPGDFAIRRIIRIVPLYWTLTLVLVLLALWRPAWLRTTVLSVQYFAQSFLFIPYANPGQHGLMFPLLVPGWSLNLEMFFYAIFTVLLLMPANRRVLVAGLVFLLAVCCVPLFAATPYAREIKFFGDYRLFEFWFGMIVAQRYRMRPFNLPRPAAWLMALAGFAVLLWGMPFLHLPAQSCQQVLLENGIPAVLILVAALSLEADLRSHALKFLAYLGDASYSIYLSHLFFLGAVRVVWAKAGLDKVSLPHAAAFSVAGLAATVLGGVLVYRWLEMPLLNLFQGLYRRRRSALRPSNAVS